MGSGADKAERNGWGAPATRRGALGVLGALPCLWLARPALADGTAPQPAQPPAKTEARDPNVGPVTYLPLPRYVSLKTDEGNARRGPGLTHRIDWVFVRAGMPLKVTAEYEHWRRVEDQDGAGGWVNYSLLSGVRTVLVTSDMAEFRTDPDAGAEIAYRAEVNVIGKLLASTADWARVSIEGRKAWAPKSVLWGVDATEVFG